MTESGTAFVPGHVTVFFSVHRRDDPAKTGSRGAGITLDDGVTVTVEPSDDTRVDLDGADRDLPPVEHVLDALDVSARVEADTDLPLGAGFGVSGAATLGTALAANRALELGHSENELVAMAHAAEVRAGTGLGDVVAQARGGVPIRTEPGDPVHGELDGVPETARIEWLSLGELSTSEVISGDTTTLSTAGSSALRSLRDRPMLPRLFDLGREFAQEAELLTPAVADVVENVAQQEEKATMAMLGKTVIALETGLTDAGYDPAVCRVHPAGATTRDA